jgi:hypothetical protein
LYNPEEQVDPPVTGEGLYKYQASENPVPESSGREDDPWCSLYKHNAIRHGKMVNLQRGRVRIPDYDFANDHWMHNVAVDVGWEFFWECALMPAHACCAHWDVSPVAAAMPLFW